MNALLMLLACIGFGIVLVASFLCRSFFPVLLIMLGSLCCTFVVFFDRYLDSLPMMPMHLGMLGITCMVGVIWCCDILADRQYHRSCESIVVLICLLILTAASILFPKDFYLPFVRSISLWAHLFFTLGIIGKGLLLYGGIVPLAYFVENREEGPSLNERISARMKLIVWGYGILALSMFTGETWSYLGWGTPVVWQDPAITTVIGLWFYWTCFLHLHYMRNWTANRRAVFMVGGGVLVLILGAHPDMGPFRMIHFLN